MLKLVLLAHILGAALWIGGMVFMRFVIHPVLGEAKDNRLGFAIAALKNAFFVFIACAIIMAASGVYLMLTLQVGALAHLKTSIWTAMAMVLGFAIWKYVQAKDAFENKNEEKCKQLLSPIASKLIPINIALGILEIFLGITLRGY